MIAKRLALLGFVVVSAVLIGCGDDGGNPTGPPPNSNSALNGVWIGFLAGPDTVQRSGWSPAYRDSILLVIRDSRIQYFMTPVAAADTSLQTSSDTCFVAYAAAFNSAADPNLSFRVNFFRFKVGWEAVPFRGTRTGNTLAGDMTLPGDTLAGRWSVALCAACADTVEECP